MQDDPKDHGAGTPDPNETADDAERKAALGESDEGGDREGDADEHEGQGRKEREDWRGRYLTETKPALEKANKLEEQVKELQAKLESNPSPTDDKQGQQEDSVLQELFQQITELDAKFAETKDPAYKGTATAIRLQLYDRQQRAIERRQEHFERLDSDYLLNATEPDENGEERPLTPERRKAIKAFFDKNRKYLPSMEVAHDNLLGREARTARTRAASERARMRRAGDNEDEDVVRVNRREIPAREAASRGMTWAQYEAKFAKLDKDDPAAADKLKRDVAHGRIPII